MEIGHLPEPELEFGGGIRHVDIRFGLMDYGPHDLADEGRKKEIRIAIVGDSASVSGAAGWFDQCRQGLPSKAGRQPNLFVPFPGLGPDGPFRCTFLFPDEMRNTMSHREVVKIAAIGDRGARERAAAEAFADLVRTVMDRTSRPDVIVCAVPQELFRQDNPTPAVGTTAAATEDEGADFRGLLKAACMELRVPIQILIPTTWNPKLRLARPLRGERRVQDDATRAWNLMTGLYYKAGGLPWRLTRDPTEYRSSFLGIAFYESLDGEKLQTSTAQLFDERGTGLILRGGAGKLSKEDRQVHLDEDDAYDLLKRALKAYRDTHKQYPARLVIHKTSPFNDAEKSGIERALVEVDVDLVDMVAVAKTDVRLYRDGGYPPLRGTFLKLDGDRLVLYSRGSVDFFRTYPGLYVPSPLILRRGAGDHDIRTLAAEALALTKMNWNNTQFDGGWPITVGAARKVGEILRFVPENGAVATGYAFYM
jgi:hypothetical protein